MPYQGVSFDDDRERNAKVSFTSRTVAGGMVGWLIRRRIVNDESQANVILIGVATVIFIISGVIFWINIFGGNTRNNQAVPPVELEATSAKVAPSREQNI